MKRLGALLVFLSIFSGMASAEGLGKLYPADEANKDPSFLEFRNHLLDAVKRHDSKSVLSATAADIQNGFGGDNGIEAFKKGWDIDSPDSDLWRILSSILTMGGRFRDGMFEAPYVFTDFPDIGDYDHAAIIHDGVSVYAEPAADSKVIATLSYDLVATPAWGEEHHGSSWVKVELADKETGYVHRGDIWGAAYYRAIFKKKDGRWLMTFLAAGD
jgi:hypothetical protein